MKILHLLNERIHLALVKVGAPKDCKALVSYSKNPDFGDYQANGVMAAAKKMKMKPRDLGEKVIEAIELEGIASKVELAGPGFINIFMEPGWLAQQLLATKGDVRELLEIDPNPEKIVVDYSGPNLAKEMHVGHLRSTIIGDAVAKVLELLGHEVIRQNHVGDWGTQFGMLITLLAEQEKVGADEKLDLSDLERFYREAKKRFDNDENFALRARNNVVALQSGDRECLHLWQAFTEQSLAHCFAIYARLGVSLDECHTRAESAYNDQLAPLVQSLEDKGLLSEDDGAQCVFLEGFEAKDGSPLPIIVQKSDGGFLYATTDLAALHYRLKTLSASRILYFVDVRQSLHFKQIFAVSLAAGFGSKDSSLEHMAFGTMLGEDKRPFKTRSGELIKLAALLDEAEERAYQLVSEKQPDLEHNEKKRIARQVGIGAVKYADLSKNRTSDYVFSWEGMLSFEGNTAPYLQYAYARIQSIFRKLDHHFEPASLAALRLVEPAEVSLSLKLLQMNDVIDSVARNGYPHYLCEYLFELTQLYMSFYEQCPVLSGGEQKASRLFLCQMTAASLKLGLDLLGIETPDSM